MCDELKDWINEKKSVLGNKDLGKDLKGVQSLQRKHQVSLINCLSEVIVVRSKIKKLDLNFSYSY